MVLTHAHPEQLHGFFLPSGPEPELSHPPDPHVHSSPGTHPAASTAEKQHTVNERCRKPTEGYQHKNTDYSKQPLDGSGALSST